MPRPSRLSRAVLRLRALRSRRGSVIVLALAVLAILAILAVAYVSVVRIDRQSSVSFGRNANFQRQVDAVVAHMQGLLAADLFGNKVVSNSVPRLEWPKMFEDGETWDYPSTDRIWSLDQSQPGTQTANIDLNNRRTADINQRVARPDDAWLAPTEPNWQGDPDSDTIAWRQISNLRSGYTWRAPGANPNNGFWDRGDGRYVDLSAWFRAPLNGYANPGVRLFENGGSPILASAGVDGANDPRFYPFTGATSATGFFGRQMASFDNGAGAQPTILEPYEERFGADADGDLRMDSRWQQLESLGNLFGLNWVVAARIIDASSLVNFQTALEFPTSVAINSTVGRTAAAASGTGETPADIDLFRLLSYEFQDTNDVFPNLYDGQIRTPNLFLLGGDSVFNDHMSNGLGLAAVTDELLALTQVNPPVANPPRFAPGGTGSSPDRWDPWASDTPTSRNQRYEYYNRVTSAQEQPLTESGTLYPRRDMIDLMSFWGTNNLAFVSKLEQRIDGPETNGFLPDPDVPSPDATGPLRARAADRDERRLGPDTGPASQLGRPSGRRLKFDIRRLLTASSGVGPVSPVPVLNADADELRNVYSKTRINLRELPSPTVDRMRQLFGDLVWALAPLATDQPLMRGVPGTTPGNAFQTGQEFHYGGGLSDGPAFAEGNRLGVAVNAGYAVARAASLAVNLVDAHDREASRLQQSPTALRVIKQTAQPTFSARGNYAVSTILDQGDIPDTLLPDQMFGAPGAGVTFFGLDNQPFLMEAHAVAAYQAPDAAAAINTPTIIDPTNRDHQMGCGLAFEIGNPFGQTIDAGLYRIRFVAGGVTYELDLADRRGTTDPLIDPGQRIIVFWSPTSGDSGANAEFAGDWDALRLQWLSKFLSNGPVVVDLNPSALTIDGTAYSSLSYGPVAFQDANNAADVRVLLIRKNTNTVLPADVLADRMAPNTGATPFPAVQSGGYAMDFVALRDAFAPLQSYRGTGRIIISSNLHRPTDNATGFPAYVVERPTENTSGLQQSPGVADVISQDFEQRWLLDPPGVVLEPAPEPMADLIDTTSLKLGLSKGGMSVSLPPFQLFVPNEDAGDPPPPLFLSDVMRISAFATNYVHASNAGYSASDLDFADDPGAGNPWTTFSEYLGLDSSLAYTGTAGGTPNPYFGVLDPSRFALTGAGMGMTGSTTAPAPLSVPLALRVLDIFAPLNPAGDLASGVININTAPARVLELLPLVAPRVGVTGPLAAAAGFTTTSADGDPPATGRVSSIINYRDDPSGNTLQLSGLRLPDVRGFTSATELAVLHRWTTDGDMVADGGNEFFATLGKDGANIEAGTDPTRQFDLDLPTYAIPSAVVNPTDDPEERLAQFRAVANLVSSRSDVFAAWFVLRGYDPEQIEKIQIVGGNNPSEAQVRLAMNNPDTPFRPRYESRWLVVFDRSNVRKPTDRPRILMKVELPSAIP